MDNFFILMKTWTVEQDGRPFLGNGAVNTLKQ
jgi:hypothetical protein